MNDDLAVGTVVKGTVRDPRGRNPKPGRPLVVISGPDERRCYLLVAISSSLPEKLTEEYVPLPYGPPGRCLTGLTKRSAAVCNWACEVHADDLEEKGFIPKARRVEVLRLHEQFDAAKRQAESGEADEST